MKIRVNVVDRDGASHEVPATVPGSLMEALRELEYGVAAACGGMCSCATCHVYVDPAWVQRLPAQQSDERDLAAELHYHRENSRLSCQIQLAAALDGLTVTLAPEE